MKRKLIAGLGITGKELVNYFMSLGEPILVYEEISESSYHDVTKINPNLIEGYFKDLPDNLWGDVSEVFISPGISQNKSWVLEARKNQVKVSGELEFAAKLIKEKFPHSKMIAVTGTNGKSTTVSLMNHILTQAQYSTALKGNIGSPLITSLLEKEKDYYVVEISSFQLETIEDFRPHISVILNITDDHLDRYESIREYGLAKKNICINQTKSDFLVYNDDDLHVKNLLSSLEVQKIPFSVIQNLSHGSFFKRERIHFSFNDVHHEYSRDQIFLGKIHDENILASIAVLEILGIHQNEILEGLKSFKGLSHRMEKVAQHEGVTFFDDSKGTNIGAVSQGLSSFDHQVILILGGKNKGGNFSILRDLIKEKCRLVYLMGEARFEIKESLKLDDIVIMKENLEEIFSDYKKSKKDGDQVVLSPGCASFDQYKNYHERGEDFKDKVDAFIQGK